MITVFVPFILHHDNANDKIRTLVRGELMSRLSYKDVTQNDTNGEDKVHLKVIMGHLTTAAVLWPRLIGSFRC
jgi:hypothetical protein